MTMTDPLGDMLTRIRNGQQANLNSIMSPASNLRVDVLGVLKREGYIRDYERTQGESGKPEIRIEVK